VRDERWSKGGDKVHCGNKTRNMLRVKLRNYRDAFPGDRSYPAGYDAGRLYWDSGWKCWPRASS
jgi:hypothetical protein